MSAPEQTYHCFGCWSVLTPCTHCGCLLHVGESHFMGSMGCVGIGAPLCTPRELPVEERTANA